MKKTETGTGSAAGQILFKSDNKNLSRPESAPFGWATKELAELKEKNLYRKFRVLENLKGTSATIEGRRVSLFCGNDYLGLSRHPKLIEVAKYALETHGVGMGSARLISGTSEWHVAVEKRIADFLGKEKALLFSSGYLANLGALSALTGKNDLIILDKLCHASLIDAARLSQATVRIYPHGNLSYLEKLLNGERKGKTWIVTDSIFSMEGDLAPLPELVKLKKQYDAYLMIDEAHGTGVWGERGRGVSEHLGLSDEVDVHIGTLSKAVGTVGGFVAGQSELIDYLVNHARTFIFETALPAAVCAAAIQAFDLIERNPEFRKRLWQNVKRLRGKLQEIGAPILEGESPIIPIVLGDEKKALAAAESLLSEGFLIPAVRYPTVPKGRARLRITISSEHSESEIDRLVKAFKQLLLIAD